MLSKMLVRGRQILYDFTYMWNPKNKTSEKQTKRKIKPINTENKLVVAEEGVEG